MPDQNFTPDDLIKAIEELEDRTSRVVMVHPINADAFENWKREYEYGKFIEIIPNHYVPMNKVYVFQASAFKLPGWLRDG